MTKKTPKKAHDPLSNVRVEPPKVKTESLAKTGGEEVADSEQQADAAREEADTASEEEAAAALKAEKQAVVLPPRNKPKKAPKYLVLRDQNVHWKGQLLKLRAKHSILSDEKFGPKAIEKFRGMGVKMQEM